jgi:hypothetical protein
MAFRDYFRPLFGMKDRGRPPKVPSRDTAVYPNLTQNLSGYGKNRLSFKPTPTRLRQFSHNPYSRRAINAIKNPIAMLEWEVVPKKGITANDALKRQIEIATYCLEHPNTDDTSRTLFEQVTEDILLGAGAIEVQVGGDPMRPLWLFPVDGLSIQIYAEWDGSPDKARYAQIVGGTSGAGVGTKTIPLRNDELMYIRPNPTTASPFGRGPLEIAFNTINKILGVGEFAGNVASNSRPSIGLDLGDGASDNSVSAFRNYWRNDVEGQGNMPIFGLSSTGTDGKTRGPSVLRFYPEGDDGLYLEYQEFLQRELAAAFDLSPQNLGIERDVNRNTSEVAEDRDRKQAIKPHAHAISSHISREGIQGALGFSQLEFQFKGIEAEDELNLAKVFETEYRNNAISPNEYRAARGMMPWDNEFSDLSYADVEIAIAAAKGAAAVEDADLKVNGRTKPKPKSGD